MGLSSPATARTRGVPGRRIRRWVILAGLLATMVTLAFTFGASFLEVYRLEREAARLEQVKHNLREQNAQLREEIRLLHTPAYIERIAREQLGLVRPGEISLLIIRPPAAPPAPKKPAPEPSWWQRLWQSIVRMVSRQP